jgi:hypothetical protein
MKGNQPRLSGIALHTALPQRCSPHHPRSALPGGVGRIGPPMGQGQGLNGAGSRSDVAAALLSPPLIEPHPPRNDEQESEMSSWRSSFVRSGPPWPPNWAQRLGLRPPFHRSLANAVQGLAGRSVIASSGTVVRFKGCGRPCAGAKPETKLICNPRFFVCSSRRTD